MRKPVDKGKAGGGKAKQNHELVIRLRQVVTPDAEERFTRATGILLKAAQRIPPKGRAQRP